MLLVPAACKRGADDPGDGSQQYLIQRAADDPTSGPLQDRDRPIDQAVHEWLTAGMTEDEIRAKIVEGLQHRVLIAPMEPNITKEKKLLTAGASVELIEYMKTVHPPEDAYHPRERVRIEEVVADWLRRGMTEEEIRAKVERGLRVDERLHPLDEDEHALTLLREAGASEELIQYLATHPSLGSRSLQAPAPQAAVEGGDGAGSS